MIGFKNTKLWLLIFLCNASIYSQNYFKDYQYLKKESQKDSGYLTDSLIKLSVNQGYFLDATKIAHAFSIELFKKQQYNEAITYALVEIKIFEKQNILNSDYINAIYNTARFYYLIDDTNNAIVNYQKILELNFNPVINGRSYGNLGECYRKLGNYNEAINYFKKGINILEIQKDYAYLFRHYMDLSNVYRNYRDPEKLKLGLNMLKKADSLSKLYNSSSQNLLYLNIAFGNYFGTKGIYNFDKATKYQRRIIKQSKNFQDSILLSTAYNNLAHLYIKEKKDSVMYFLNKGLKYVKQDIIKARLYDNYCEYLIQNHKFHDALKSIHTSLQLNVILNDSINSIPSKLNLLEAKNKHYVLFCLKKKTDVLIKLYNKEKDPEYLKNALKNCISADVLIDIIHNGSYEDKTKMYWREEASEVYIKGAYCAHLLEDNNLMFYFMEKNKALLLNEGIATNTKQINLPIKIAKKNIYYKKTVLNIENNIDNTVETVSKIGLQDSLFNTRTLYNKFLDSIKIAFPKYFENQFNIGQTSLGNIKKQLHNKTVIASYIWNKIDGYETILGLLITKNKCINFEITNSEELNLLLQKYRQLLSKPLETKEDLKEYKRVSFNLYQVLFPIKEVRDIINKKELIIIPDGNLQNIPFEALITKKESNAYLIKTNAISYAYSLSFLKHNNKVVRNPTYNFNGYAPVTFNHGELYDLKNTEFEIKAVKNIIGGTILLKNEASKVNFLTKSKYANIIHLATHANATNNPWIAFTDGKLQLHELYTYKNSANLVVLSACNSSLGTIISGEGVMSLARGFFYSGSNSVVSSLWQVNDKSSSKLINDFYKNIEKGNTKSEALQRAKLSYLESHQLSDLSPYYWSSFILIGDSRHISSLHNHWPLFLIILVLILLLVTFLYWKLKTINKQ